MVSWLLLVDSGSGSVSESDSLFCLVFLVIA